MRKSKLRIKGNDRGLMMICRDIRRRWLQYGENRSQFKTGHDVLECMRCGETVGLNAQIDHIKPLGARPRKWEELGKYAKAMFERECQALCKPCHKQKTDLERKRRKKNAK